MRKKHLRLHSFGLLWTSKVGRLNCFIDFLFDFTSFLINIHQIMLIPLFPTPFHHSHFHTPLGLDPALKLTLHLNYYVGVDDQNLILVRYSLGSPIGPRHKFINRAKPACAPVAPGHVHSPIQGSHPHARPGRWQAGTALPGVA